MRVFTAVEFKPEIKEYLAEITEQVADKAEKGNFTAMENFHLTLKFIGEAEGSDIEILKDSIVLAAERIPVFDLYFSGLGFFPRGEKKIIWAGVHESEELRVLQEKVEGIMSGRGYREKKEHPFMPHITLGRRVEMRGSFRDLQEEISLDGGMKICITRVSLMESTRINGMVKYRRLFSRKLSEK